MKKLFALASVSMMAFTVPPVELPDVPAKKTCSDGAVVMQDEDCPDKITLRHVSDHGSIYRRTCPLQDQRIGLTGWTIALVPLPPFVIPVPEFGIVCDYGRCGTYPLEDLVGDGGPS